MGYFLTLLTDSVACLMTPEKVSTANHIPPTLNTTLR